MRYVQLRAFHHVAVHGGFSRAAEALGLTQPAISDQVRKLEAEYDIRLFDREKKQIRLTAAGRELLEITNRLFEVEARALLEAELARRNIGYKSSIEAEGREAVQEIVAAGGGVGFVSRAELGNDNRLVALELDDTELTMNEAIICLRERRDSKVIRSFMTIARGNAKPPAS